MEEVVLFGGNAWQRSSIFWERAVHADMQQPPPPPRCGG